MLIRSLVALSLSAVVLAGCGDDKPESASTPAPAPQVATTPDPAAPATTPQEQPEGDSAPKEKAKSKDAPPWVDDVNARCVKYQKQTTEVLTDFQKKGATSPESAVEAMQEIMPLGRQMVDDLRNVDVPSDVKDPWNSFLDTIGGAFDLMPQMAKAAAAGKQDAELMKKFSKIAEDTRPFADKYGLSECLSS